VTGEIENAWGASRRAINRSITQSLNPTCSRESEESFRNKKILAVASSCGYLATWTHGQFPRPRGARLRQKQKRRQRRLFCT